MSEQIVVRVMPDGTVRAETKGIKGDRCLDQIALLEELLEATTARSSFTSEYDEPPIETTGITNEQR